MGAEDEQGGTFEAELGTSAAFRIADPTDPGGRGHVFALRGIAPLEGFAVTFSLPNAEPAQLEIYDVRGRRVASSQVGQLGPGRTPVLSAARSFCRGAGFLAEVLRSGPWRAEPDGNDGTDRALRMLLVDLTTLGHRAAAPGSSRRQSSREPFQGKHRSAIGGRPDPWRTPSSIR
jgi:hypothetical protein